MSSYGTSYVRKNSFRVRETKSLGVMLRGEYCEDIN
jgi:hypothetical protein